MCFQESIFFSRLPLPPLPSAPSPLPPPPVILMHDLKIKECDLVNGYILREILGLCQHLPFQAPN